MQQHAQSRWPAVMLIYALSVASAMVISEGVPVLGRIAGEFHPPSPAIIGAVMSLPALVVALGGLLTGWLVDKAGDRRLLLIGGVTTIVGDLGVISSHAIAPLLAWRVVGGVGYLLMAVSAVTMMTRITQGRQRVTALALWSTVIPGSFILAFAVGGLLFAHDWRWVFGAHAAISAALLVLGAIALPARAIDDPRISRTSGLLQVLRSPGPYALGFSFAAAAFLQSGMIAVLAPLLAARLGISEAQVEPFGILAMLFNMGGALAVGALLNRGVAAWIIGLVGVVMAALGTIALGMFVTGLANAIAVNCVLMLGCGLLAGMWALLPRVAPSPQTIGATSGLITQITLLGVLFGAPASFAALGLGPVGFMVLTGIMILATLGAVPIWLKKSSQFPASGTPGAPAESALH